MTSTQKLRQLLWLHHGCRSNVLYGDDGEMQCTACLIDFKRMSPAELEVALNAEVQRRAHHEGVK